MYSLASFLVEVELYGLGRLFMLGYQMIML